MKIQLPSNSKSGAFNGSIDLVSVHAGMATLQPLEEGLTIAALLAMRLLAAFATEPGQSYGSMLPSNLPTPSCSKC